MPGWTKKMIDTNRGQFEVFLIGSGNPVCVTHHYSEFNETGDYFAESFSKTHLVILVNLREAGQSNQAIHPYEFSMIEAVFDLESIRIAMGYNKWTFAGHSTGGMIGILYGIYYSDSLNNLILVGTAAREYSSSEHCIYNRKHPQFGLMQSLIEQLKQTDLSNEDRSELSKQRIKLSLYSPDKYEHYFNLNIHKKISAKRMNFFNREMLTYDVTKKLPNITTETLVLCGEYDVQCPLPFSNEIHENIQSSKLVIFNKSNHYPFLEEREQFLSIVRQFLE